MKEVFSPKDLPIGTPFRLDTHGNSMQNFIKQGDVLLAQRVEPKNLAMGDIVVFRHGENDNFITHRLLFRKKKDGSILYIFKGDSRVDFDAPVPGENIIGKVLVIERSDRRIELNTLKGQLINWFFFLMSLCILFPIKASCAFVKNKLFCKSFWIPPFIELRRRLKLKTHLQNFVVKTGKNKILNRTYRAYYILAIKSFKTIYSYSREIESIHLRRQVAKGNWQPGSSDIDLSVIIKEMPYDKEVRFLRSFWRDYAWLRKAFPFLGEVEIITRVELQNWQRTAGVRSQEVVHWKKIYSREKTPRLQPILGDDTGILNYLCESLQSFWTLSVYISMRREDNVYPYEFRKLFNLVADVIRFTEKIKGEDTDDERQVFILKSISRQHDGMFRRGLKRFVAKIFSNSSYIDNKELFDIYAHMIDYLDKNCGVIYQKLTQYENRFLNEPFLIRDLSRKVDINEGSQDVQWRQSVSEAAGVFGDSLLSILSNSHVFTNHSFIVLKEGLHIDDVKEVCRKAFSTLRNKSLAVVTENILQCISCSLSIETAFNYWHLVEQASLDFGEDPKKYLEKPPDFVISGLLNKSVSQFNMYFRRFPINRIPTYLLYHSIDNLMRLRLALEKKIIVCSLDDAINEYKVHFDDEIDLDGLKNLERYLIFSEKELDGLSNQYIFYENFAFVRYQIKRLNDITKEAVEKAYAAGPGESQHKEFRRAKDTEIKCIKPWTSLFFDNNEIRFCCRSKFILSRLHPGVSISDFWNNDVAQYIRRKILEGRIVDVCQEICPALSSEEASFVSFQKRRNNFTDNELKIYEHIENSDVAIDSKPSELEAVIDHVCNLRCKMCFIFEDPGYVISSGFYDIVDEIHESLRFICLIGGEPFISKRARAFIYNCLRKQYNFKFKFVTNGTIFDREFLSKVPVDGFCVSIDGATKETYEGIRRGSDFDKVISNLKSLIRLREEKPEPFSIRVAFLVMTSTFREIPKAIELFEPLGVQLEFPPIIQKPGDPENIFDKEEYYDEFRQVLQEAREKTRQDMVVNSLNILENILNRHFIDGSYV